MANSCALTKRSPWREHERKVRTRHSLRAASESCDLASMAGRYLVAVHCARQLPTASLHRLVRGAAGAGLWLLLEEVAALPQPSLLLLAQQARANRSPLPSGFPLA